MNADSRLGKNGQSLSVTKVAVHNNLGNLLVRSRPFSALRIHLEMASSSKTLPRLTIP
jgi:hypothetical protein